MRAAQAAARALTAQVGALLASGASVDEHTADQMIVYMVPAEGANPKPEPEPKPTPLTLTLALTLTLTLALALALALT
jgi:hypothetical protein